MIVIIINKIQFRNVEHGNIVYNVLYTMQLLYIVQ